jgi:hypothetical protein
VAWSRFRSCSKSRSSPGPAPGPGPAPVPGLGPVLVPVLVLLLVLPGRPAPGPVAPSCFHYRFHSRFCSPRLRSVPLPLVFPFGIALSPAALRRRLGRRGRLGLGSVPLVGGYSGGLGRRRPEKSSGVIAM